MTKVGENNLPPKVPGKETARQNLELSAAKFENALQSYRGDPTGEEKERLKAIMDEQLGLIKQAVDEIKLKGLHKQEGKVESDYKAFISSESEESYAALEHDVQTLRDYNNISPTPGGGNGTQNPPT